MLTEAKPKRRPPAERYRARRAAHKRDLLPHRVRTAEQKRGDKARARAMRRGGMASRIAALAASHDFPATLTGAVKHPRAYVDLVVEVAGYLTAEPNIQATGPREFAQQFLRKSATETNTPTGLAAILFEAYLIQNEEALYSQLLETFVEPGDQTFLAIFEGPIPYDRLQRLVQSVRAFVETKVLVRHGDRSDHEVSDLTILECRPRTEGMAALGQQTPPGGKDPAATNYPRATKPDLHQRSEPSRAPIGPFEALRPQSEADYARVQAEGGISLELVERLYGRDLEITPEPTPDGGTLLFFEDGQGGTWYSKGGQTWTPLAFPTDAARADQEAGDADEARRPDRPDVSKGAAEFQAKGRTAMQKVLGQVQLDPTPGMSITDPKNPKYLGKPGDRYTITHKGKRLGTIQHRQGGWQVKDATGTVLTAREGWSLRNAVMQLVTRAVGDPWYQGADEAFIPGRDRQKARKQAQANANTFGVPYAIFTDTSGNLRVERASKAPKHVQPKPEIVHPQSPKESQAVDTVSTDEAYTPGLRNAMQRSRHRMACEDCGFHMPVYPGRYPRHCPHCEGAWPAGPAPVAEPVDAVSEDSALHEAKQSWAPPVVAPAIRPPGVDTWRVKWLSPVVGKRLRVRYFDTEAQAKRFARDFQIVPVPDRVDADDLRHWQAWLVNPRESVDEAEAEAKTIRRVGQNYLAYLGRKVVWEDTSLAQLKKKLRQMGYDPRTFKQQRFTLATTFPQEDEALDRLVQAGLVEGRTTTPKYAAELFSAAGTPITTGPIPWNVKEEGKPTDAALAAYAKRISQIPGVRKPVFGSIRLNKPGGEVVARWGKIPYTVGEARTQRLVPLGGGSLEVKRGAFKIAASDLTDIARILKTAQPDVDIEYTALGRKGIARLAAIPRDALAQAFGKGDLRIDQLQDYVARQPKRAFQAWLRNLHTVDKPTADWFRKIGADDQGSVALIFYAWLKRIHGSEMARIILKRHFATPSTHPGELVRQRQQRAQTPEAVHRVPGFAPDPIVEMLAQQGVIPGGGAEMYAGASDDGRSATLSGAIRFRAVEHAGGTLREHHVREDDEAATYYAATHSSLRPYPTKGYRVVSADEFVARMESAGSVAQDPEDANGATYTDYLVWLDQANRWMLCGQIVDDGAAQEYRIFGQDPDQMSEDTDADADTDTDTDDTVSTLDEAKDPVRVWLPDSAHTIQVDRADPAVAKILRTLKKDGDTYYAGRRSDQVALRGKVTEALPAWRQQRQSYVAVLTSGGERPLLGGRMKVSSSAFAREKDALDYAEQAAKTNKAAGRPVSFRVVQVHRRPEIGPGGELGESLDEARPIEPALPKRATRVKKIGPNEKWTDGQWDYLVDPRDTSVDSRGRVLNVTPAGGGTTKGPYESLDFDALLAEHDAGAYHGHRVLPDQPVIEVFGTGGMIAVDFDGDPVVPIDRLPASDYDVDLLHEAKVSKAAANYSDGPFDTKTCDTCANWQGGGVCRVVAGTIRPKGRSDRYQPRSATEDADESVDEADTPLQQARSAKAAGYILAVVDPNPDLDPLFAKTAAQAKQLVRKHPGSKILPIDRYIAGRTESVDEARLKAKTVPDQHAEKIALKTLRMPAPMRGVMGQSKADALATLQRLGYTAAELRRLSEDYGDAE